jgi:hypothetical protein
MVAIPGGMAAEAMRQHPAASVAKRTDPAIAWQIGG